MNRFVSVIVGVIATLFGLMAAPGLTPTSSAAPAHGYDYDARHYTTVCPDTMTERGPTWSCDRGSTYDAVDGRSNGATVRPSEPITRTIYRYDDTALLVRADSALGKTTQLALGRKGVVSSFQRWQVAANSADDLARLTVSQQRSVRSLQSQVKAHQTKLDGYRANPDAYDNLGILERAPTPEIRQRIIDGRIRHLETEIRTFQDQIDKLLGGG